MRVHVASGWHRYASLALALSFVLGQTGVAAAEPAPALKTFVATHRCALLERLIAVHSAGDRNSMRDRFLILGRADQPQAYVQCGFQERGRHLLCEASSGFYSSRPGEPRRFRLGPGQTAKLARYKFSADDSRGNFRRMIELGETINLSGVASMMLNVMHDIYGANISTRVTVNAPLVSRDVAPLASNTCAPAS